MRAHSSARLRLMSTCSIGNKMRRGFTLLFAMIISSIVLSIGLGIFNIALKELVLSSAARESQFAFFAADTGTECALYWDIRYRDPDHPEVTSAFDPDWRQAIQCAGQVFGEMGGNPSSHFVLDF